MASFPGVCTLRDGPQLSGPQCDAGMGWAHEPNSGPEVVKGLKQIHRVS